MRRASKVPPRLGLDVQASGRRRLAPRRLLEAVTQLLFCGTVIAVVVVGLQWNSETRALGRLNEADEGRGEGIIVRESCSEIWLSEEWNGIKECRDLIEKADTFEKLAACLEQLDKRELWYVIELQGHQINGDETRRRMIRKPFEQPIILDEFREVVRIVSGGPAAPEFNFGEARVTGIPGEYQGLGPALLHARLLQEGAR